MSTVRIRCNNGPEHHHSSVQESRECWSQGPAHASVSTITERKASPAQLKFIADLGGDAEGAAQYNTREASNYIKQLKQARSLQHTPATRSTTTRPGSLAYTQPSKLEMVLPLLGAVPDGYFAVQPDTTVPLTFVRLSTVKRKDSAQHGWRRIQTIHGPNMDLAAAVSPEGRVREYRSGVDDTVLLVIADYQGAALRYAKEIGKCCRCNTRLTDERSRHYGIGPECEQHWPWVIEMVDERNAEQSS